jgi:hypothetical protein
MVGAKPDLKLNDRCRSSFQHQTTTLLHYIRTLSQSANTAHLRPKLAHNIEFATVDAGRYVLNPVTS